MVQDYTGGGGEDIASLKLYNKMVYGICYHTAISHLGKKFTICKATQVRRIQVSK